MVSLLSLWLPILVSAAVIFVASFLAWMVLPHHKADFKKLPDEDKLAAAIAGAEPAQYMFPFCAGSAEMRDPEFQSRWNKGPHGLLVLRAGPPSMGMNMAITFLFYILVGIFVGYLTGVALPAGADYLNVFQVAGTAAVMAYVFGSIPNAIWFGRPWRAVGMDAIDGVVYGLLTAGVFGWLWPAAERIIS